MNGKALQFTSVVIKQYISLCLDSNFHSAKLTDIITSGHLWTAKWWSYGDVPGGKYPARRSTSYAPTHLHGLGAAGDWTDDGACTTVALAHGAFVAAHYESKAVPLDSPVQTPDSEVPKSKNSRFFQL